MNMFYLKYKMKEAGFTSETFAAAIEMSLTSYYKRTSGQIDWTCKDMKLVKDVLNLDQEEFNKIFGF